MPLRAAVIPSLTSAFRLLRPVIVGEVRVAGRPVAVLDTLFQSESPFRTKMIAKEVSSSVLPLLALLGSSIPPWILRRIQDCTQAAGISPRALRHRILC